MLTQISSENPNGLDQYLSPNIGQVYTADKQCELSVGTGSFVCRVSFLYELSQFIESISTCVAR